MTDQGGSLPHPLVPPDADLRDFPFMPVDIARLFGSEFHGQSSDTEWRAGVTLWLKSYHQVPAASLPADDVQLARLAEFGRDIRGWKKVRSKALRGWTECRDGRLYHPVVAEKALEAWIGRLSQRIRSAIGHAKRWNKDTDVSSIERDLWHASRLLQALNPEAHVFRREDIQRIIASMPQALPEACPEHAASMPQALPEACPEHAASMPQALPEACPEHAASMPQALPEACPEACQVDRGKGIVVVFQPGGAATSQDVEQGAPDDDWDTADPFGPGVAR
ncbi:DUF1376 domain-containing protein [Xanthobacter sediminis]